MSLNPRLRDWQGRRVWLIGASSGIGRATASLLHGRGARVIVSARQAAALDDFVAAHPGSQALALDITDRAALQQATDQLLAAGPLDLVCYLAGHYRPMRAMEIDLDDALRHQQVNLTGVWHLLAALLPALLAQGHGHVSLVSSVAGFRGLPRSLAYGPTKAALINLAVLPPLPTPRLGRGVSVIPPASGPAPLPGGSAFPMPALLTPEQAAAEIVRGWERGEFMIHFPKRFSRFLLLLRLLPYRAYFALVRRLTGL